MAAQIPTQEPTVVTAGDTVKWTRHFPDFLPADGWTVTYYFQFVPGGSAPPIIIVSSASGNDHLFDADPSITQQWLSGEWNGQAYASNGTDRYKVWEGSWTVEPDFSTIDQVDTRSQARRALDAVNAALERLASKDVVECTIEGVQMRFRDPKDLMALRDMYLADVNAEDAAVTGGPRRAIFTRFTQPA